jgi:hypothetical protein
MRAEKRRTGTHFLENEGRRRKEITIELFLQADVEQQHQAKEEVQAREKDTAKKMKEIESREKEVGRRAGDPGLTSSLRGSPPRRRPTSAR